MAVTLDQARGAKQKAKLLSLAPGAAVGLTKKDGSYCLKVNLRAPVEANLPKKVDGVPVIYEVVGPITKRATVTGTVGVSANSNRRPPYRAAGERQK